MFNANATVCYGIAAPSPNVLEVSLTSNIDYATPPFNQWSTGAVTICWPASAGSAVITGVTATTTLPYGPDFTPTMVGTNFCQKFTFGAPSTLNLMTGMPVTVIELQLDAACMSEVEFFIDPMPGPPVVNGDAAIINALAEQYAPGDCATATMGACVPTMGEWALVSFTLILLSLALIQMQHETKGVKGHLLYFR